MNEEIILDNVIPKPVFGFNYSTLMLFRCTTRKRAEEFLQGKIYLGSPQQWIDIKKKGQGDLLEGVIFSTKEDDSADLVRSLKADSSLEYFTHSGFLFFRRKAVLELRCLCLYGLHDNRFEKRIDNKGKAHHSFRISRDYFSSFSDSKTREESEKADYCDQPVVIVIGNPHEFFSRIRSFLLLLDVKEEEIIISPVEYIDRYAVMIAAVPPPTELLLKDVSFENQSEVRIIVNSTSPKYLEYMRDHNNTIEVEPLEDLAEVFEYYYEDMYLERLGNKRIMYTLPTPSYTNIRDMSFIELADHLFRIMWGEVVLIGVPPEWDTLEKQLKPLADLFRTKFGVTLSVDKNNRVSLGNMSDEQQRQIQEKYKSKLCCSEFQDRIDFLIRQGKIEEAKTCCLKACQDKTLLGVAFFCLGKLYSLQQDCEEAIAAYQQAIDNDYNRVESLSGIAGIYFGRGEYDKAMEIYRSIQDEMGYDFRIWNNLGLCYHHLGQYKKAVECFDKGLSLCSSDASLYYNKGVACYMLRQTNLARDYMEKAIKLDPDNEFYLQESKKCFKTH